MHPLKQARIRAGLNHRKAASELGTSTTLLCRYERGDAKRMDADLLCRMADLYGLTLDQLTGRAPLPEAGNVA
jgi:transcriptional regulator with XRE-family HTH domain